MNRRPFSLRTRLMASAILGAAVALAVLVTAFNLLLDARLGADADNLLRERAATALRNLSVVDGRLSAIEAPDKGAVDTQTWVFAGERTVEQPAGVDPRNQQAARSLAAAGHGFATVDATDTRLAAVPVRQASRLLGTAVVAASVAPYESTASSALLGSVALAVAMLLAVAALSRWLIGHALRPVARMTSQAADWGEHDLSRRFFSGEPHDELSTLASVFDGLLARVAQSLKREQQLTAEVSHELRTPLAKILAEAEMAAGRERTPDQYRAALAHVSSYGQELQRVLETLLASARAEMPGRVSASDARTSVERAVEPLRASLAAQGKSIELRSDRPIRVAVESEVVERILSPLLENAARFATRGVTVEMRTHDGEVVFEVRDDGPGVDPSERERIFEPGFRGARHGEDHAGTGLGLALVRRLARAAGGDVEARALGDGGRFAVRLPAA
jgi:two-component system, OmpR family, sensor kinase